MTPEEFRRYGHQVIDWIADYYERIEKYPVLSQVAPGEIAAALPASPPAEGEPFEAVLRDLDEVLMPGITHDRMKAIHYTQDFLADVLATRRGG